ncbi:MAG: TetR/AcrR family transcriptional regulator [Actinobacteria bacterium]|nr:TetR/AcrR family transcriptional regulator [Actinomycetota bacterium]MBU1944428.1 TetR/AcrR family transcriptional regulator [Actinomycetota bacterium]MBU2688214.1 TetR/AcrR family transcriptional regulator [Actinomycetota bacterium]
MAKRTITTKKGRGPGAGTRTQIMDAALRRFSEKGYLGATTADIAAEAGVSEKTIFDLFGDKKTLYLQLRDELRERALSEIIPRLPIGGGAPAVLRSLGREFAREVRQNRDRARVNVQAATALDDPDVMRSAQAFYKDLERLVMDILVEGRKAGLIRPDLDLEQFAWTYVMAIHSLGFIGMMDAAPPSRQEAALVLIDRLVDHAEEPGRAALTP